MKNNILQDITFIGSGISTSFTLLHILKKYKDKPSPYPLKITIFDTYKEFNTGIPYGSRSGFSVLLITSLRNFLPQPELGLFLEWLRANKEWLLDEFLKEGGTLSKEWLAEHKKEIDTNAWEDLFIPRRFFGVYLNRKVESAIEKSKNIVVTYINEEVLDVKQFAGYWKVYTKDNTENISKKVVLSVGSLPTNTLWKNKTLIKEKNLLFLNNPYKAELSSSLQLIKERSKENSDNLNIVIVGANASGLELIYKINDDNAISDKVNSFTILSTQGVLPDCKIDINKLATYIPTSLKSLVAKEDLSSQEIADATFADLDRADTIGLGAASTVDIISSAFGTLLKKLDKGELKKFACNHGNEIGRRQRVAGVHYLNTIERLKKEKRFQHIAGRFSNMEEKDGNYYLEFLDTATKNTVLINKPIHIVINCVGGMRLDMDKIPKLLKNMLDKGYIAPNDSKIGIELNQDMEASPNLHVIGPLVAGNIINNKAVWHAEHCGRIIAISKLLADKLIQPKGDLELKVYDLSKKTDKEDYIDSIKKNWNNNPYYLYDYLSHHISDTENIIAFEIKNEKANFAIMPIIKRVIQGCEYFDVISPYSYSGPLYKDYVESSTRLIFWQLVDKWYQKNNIVSEFIRFSLNANHRNYNGYCKPTLSNVCGNLCDTFEKQWESFLPKVRNNYRKAQSHNVSFKIFDKENINKEHIAAFYSIYVKTMKRNNAEKYLYFSLDYFKKLVLNNPSSFALAMVYCKNEPVSSELIILKDNIVFAFLGGTDACFFNVRPNDFLRVEVIKWAIRNAKKKYILGGGISNNDGLYKSKKALFPKDGDIIFYTGRKIMDLEKYNALNTTCNEDLNDYFPAYRK